MVIGLGEQLRRTTRHREDRLEVAAEVLVVVREEQAQERAAEGLGAVRVHPGRGSVSCEAVISVAGFYCSRLSAVPQLRLALRRVMVAGLIWQQ